tara:strand:- start:79 stop:333 length:255 start_codon:yes stop_codon:yes gene_type:complete
MSKHEEHEDFMNRMKKKKKGENSKIERILKKIDHLETLMLKLLKAFYIPENKPALDRSEIQFVGESSDDDEPLPAGPAESYVDL